LDGQLGDGSKENLSVPRNLTGQLGDSTMTPAIGRAGSPVPE